MESYELTLVLPGKTTPAKKRTLSEKIGKLVEAHKGKVKKEEDWGLKELAYKIGKNDSGVFLHFVLELEPKFAKEFAEKIRREESFIRYLLVKAR